MTHIKLRDIQLQDELLDRDLMFRVGYCEELKRYVLVVCVPWVVYYDRYFAITEDDYNLYKNNRDAFVERYHNEIFLTNEITTMQSFMGGAALRDYDCRNNLASLFPVCGNPFKGHVYWDERLWANIMIADDKCILVPPQLMVNQDGICIYPLRDVAGVALFSYEVNGQVQPVCYGILMP